MSELIIETRDEAWTFRDYGDFLTALTDLSPRQVRIYGIVFDREAMHYLRLYLPSVEVLNLNYTQITEEAIEEFLLLLQESRVRELVLDGTQGYFPSLGTIFQEGLVETLSLRHVKLERKEKTKLLRFMIGGGILNLSLEGTISLFLFQRYRPLLRHIDRLDIAPIQPIRSLGERCLD